VTHGFLDRLQWRTWGVGRGKSSSASRRVSALTQAHDEKQGHDDVLRWVWSSWS